MQGSIFGPYMLFRFIQKFFINISIYLALLATFENNEKYFNLHGIMGSTFNFSEYILSKSESLLKQIEYKNLAINFLSNKRILNDTEKIAFQSSGLVHLLAVSGAQIIPVCQLFSFVIIQFVYFFLRKYFSSVLIMKIIYYLKNFSIILVSFSMTGLFSCAGALVRVTFLSAINEFLKFQKYLYVFSSTIPFFSVSLVRRCVLILLASILFGNIFLDYSFLLSSIGAATLEITALFLNIFLKKINMEKKIKFFVQPLLLTIFTSFFVSIILFPVSRISFFLSSFSNILAAPIVTFLITPFSLILLFTSEHFVFHGIILKLFDYSLGILNFIAEVFQDSTYSLQIPKILLFTYEGKLYLILILIVLFSISDVIRSRDEEYLREFFQAIRRKPDTAK